MTQSVCSQQDSSVRIASALGSPLPLKTNRYIKMLISTVPIVVLPSPAGKRGQGASFLSLGRRTGSAAIQGVLVCNCLNVQVNIALATNTAAL